MHSSPCSGGRLGRLTSLTARPSTGGKHPAYTPVRAPADDASLIWAAVAVVITPDPDAILLIRRADRAGDPWSGHIALPGGRREPADQDLLSTAIRETHEELGLELNNSQLVGSLDDVAPRTPVLPPVAVRPFVFLVPARPPLTLNSEVASAHWVSLDHLQQPERHQPAIVDVAGIPRQVQAFHLDIGVVWGMTERILSSLSEHLKN